MNATASERRKRLTEALLLFCVTLCLLVGGLLVGLAKTPRDTTAPVNLNTAKANELAAALGGDSTLAQKIVASRSKDSAFEDVDGLARRKLLTSADLRESEERFAVRPWAAVQARFVLTLVGLVLVGWILHFLVRLRHPKADPYLLPVAFLLVGLGVLLLFGLKDPIRDKLSFFQQFQGALLGGIALLVGLSRRFWAQPLHRYGYLYALGAVGLIALLALFGSGQGGVKLNLLGFQPVELIKLLMVFFLAAYLADRGQGLFENTVEARRSDLYPLLGMYALPLLLFALLKDLGPALLLFGAFLALIYLVSRKVIFVWLGLAAILLGGWVGYLLQFGVFKTRVDMFLHPWDNTGRGGDQLALGLWGLSSGGALGSGLGLGGTRFIPRGGSDLAFASLGEELGIFGVLVVVLCLLVLLWRGLAISRQAPSDFERYLAGGLAALLALQGLVIIAGCLGLFPLTGITLPLIAYGKSSVVTTFFAIGLLLGLSSRTDRTAVMAPEHLRRTLPKLGMALTVPLLACAAVALVIQTVQADRIALREARVPDADQVVRAHRNPRLLQIANAIPRGRILDRRDVVLAETRDGKRVYPLGAPAAHLIGLYAARLGGPTGLEAELGVPLRGLARWDDTLGLWRAKDLPGFTLPKGKDVRLTLDASLQHTAQESLIAWAAKNKDKRTGQPKRAGAAVVLDVATGAILAAVTAPTYNPNLLTPERLAELSRDKDGAPLLNRAFQGLYPPGSTFKIVTATSLLQNGQGDATFSGGTGGREWVKWVVDDTALGRKITNDEGEALGGKLSLTDAIVHSSNIYFAHAAIALGPETFRETATTFSLAHLPPPRKWQMELPDLGYGQGSLLVTPLEMASVAQAVAAGGALYKPYLVADTPTTLLGTPLTTENAAVLARALRGVTRSGTAAGRFSELPLAVAGKTGTAQTSNGDGRSHSWFVGFYPAKNPKIAFAVIVENGGYGSRSAVPVTREILAAYKPAPP